MADELGLPADAAGVVVYKVDKAPAARFFKPGDILLDVNGAKIASVDSLNAALGDSGSMWRFTINRGGRVLKLAIGG